MAGFDVGRVINAYQAGQQAKQADIDRQQKAEDRQFQIDLQKHQLKALQLQDKAQVRAEALQNFDLMRGQPAPEVQTPGQAGDSETGIIPTGGSTAPQVGINPQTVTGALPPMTIPGVQGPDTTLRPQSQQDIAAQTVKQHLLDLQMDALKPFNVDKDALHVTPSLTGGAPSVVSNPKTEQDFELKTGISGGQQVTAKFDRKTGKAFDLMGKELPDFQEKAPNQSEWDEWMALQPKVQTGTATPQEKLRFAALQNYRIAPALAALQANQPKGALAQVAPHLVVPAANEYNKISQSFVGAKQAADDMQTFINDAEKGNKIAYSYAPVEGVLTLNTSRGVKRVNFSEIASYGGAGSAADRLKAFFGKQVSGASVPKNILEDMRSIHGDVLTNAKSAYSNGVKVVNTTYGSAFDPVDLSTGAGSGSSEFDFVPGKGLVPRKP